MNDSISTIASILEDEGKIGSTMGSIFTGTGGRTNVADGYIPVLEWSAGVLVVSNGNGMFGFAGAGSGGV